MNEQFARQIHWLKAYAALSSIFLLVLLLTAFRDERGKKKFGEIDAERINIVEPDGRVYLVITDKDRFPPPIWKGKPMDIKRHGMASKGIPGIVFYNTEGDEAGGIAFSSSTQDGKHQARATLMFDQYEQDQVVGINYQEENNERTAGLHVWERPNIPLIDLIRKFQSIQSMPEGPAKQAAMNVLQAAQNRGEFGGQDRVFVGKDLNNSSEVKLADARGRPRIRITVEANGQSHLEFLDEQGKVTYSLPPH